MKKNTFPLIIILLLNITAFYTAAQTGQKSWVRINLLGYQPGSPKVAVWCSKDKNAITDFSVIDITSGKTVYTGRAGRPFGVYGPFTATYRLNFTAFTRPGRYVIKAGDVSSPEFTIGADVYKGTADFCLRYMRQQRSGFNPFLKDSCHTHDGYTLYGPMPDSTRIDASGGWHDASDYLQYVTTSANATWHLLAAGRDFPGVFGDAHLANGLPGQNKQADVLDEARWGLNWLLKMHPRKDWLFNQIADDRDHQGMRIPKQDSFYGRGYERPVYFCTGQPQGFGRYKNRSTGVASTAGKFASAFALGAVLFRDTLLQSKALSAWELGVAKPGVCQTAPGRSPYFYEEDNWTDDMELAGASIYSMNTAYKKQLSAAYAYAQQETVTPWLGRDTARHYQWYPFINAGHYELARQVGRKEKKQLMGYYRQGIERVWQKAKKNAFYRGIPFIWCSNNLTTSFAIQCYWYRQLTGETVYSELEQANFDWLFGCNPWGTSMVYGLPAGGDTPADPHSAFTHLGHYPIDGGLVDGPVYGNIYKNLIGITLNEPDEYADFQSDLVVYHDDYGDYSTNEPTMDGTASLIYLLAAKEAGGQRGQHTAESKQLTYEQGAIIRGDTGKKKLALVFTGDEYGDGAGYIAQLLQQQNIKASFFFTGRFYRNPAFKRVIRELKKQGHYLGPHSDAHLLYCDWKKRDSLLVTKEQFNDDLNRNYKAMEAHGISRKNASVFLPPFEWYNDTIAAWSKQLGIQLVNFTPGTYSNADYTTPDMKNYRSSASILDSIINYEQRNAAGLNGFILLLHLGTHPARTDKFYHQLPLLIEYLREKRYVLTYVNELIK
ncbi:glycoside hydrolase family 9 protein [Longitalea luteola]|uniref:glycoside hydrolase family 9 protein n=1 Tax=Longitalea luteola TaxID=2812563 RepID=UPI001A9667E4